MKKELSLLVILVLVAALLVGCGSAAQPAPATQATTAATETTAAPAAESAPQRLTMEQLEQLRDDGKVTYVLSDQGYVTWLQGDIFDETIKDGEAVTAAVELTRDLLGLDENAQFTKNPAVQLNNGYTYYPIRQFSGGTSVENAIIKVIADPDGKAVAISSSVVPGVGSEMELMISPQEALETAKAYLTANQPDRTYTFYPDTIGKTIVTLVSGNDMQQVNAAYIVYTNNPDASNEETDLHYLAHYIGSNGNYLYSMPVHNIEDEDALVAADAERYFEGLQEASYTGDVTLYDGSVRQVTVPVLYDEAEGKYYLADAQRKIAVLDAYAFQFENRVDRISSPDNTGWDDNDLITYANYITVYDFYADIGLRSPNGLDMPIAILSDYRDEAGNPDDNACYNGVEHGWHTFGSSTLNNYGQCVDVLAHEFTHGFTLAMMTNILYAGEAGAINESFSDMMGNLIEMMSGSTEDTTWLVAENCGAPIRNMSDPHQFSQPEFIGDVYYRSMSAPALPYTDNGGVHLNNSLLAGIAVDLERAGMSMEDQFSLWCHLICALTPRSGFEELLPMLHFSCDIMGAPQWKDVIDEAFAKRGLIVEADTDPLYAEGCGILEVNVTVSENVTPLLVYLLDPETNQPLVVPPYFVGADGSVSCAHPAGAYKVFVRLMDTTAEDITTACSAYVYTESGWQYTEDFNITGPKTADLSICVPVTIEEGDTTTLETLIP